MILGQNKTKLVLIGERDMLSICIDSRLEEFHKELMALINEYKCSDFERIKAS